MGDYDLKPNFPIASVAQLLADRTTKEAAMKAQQHQQLVEGLKMFGTGVQSLVDRRNHMAQALTQADILMKNPEIMQQLGDTQIGTQTPPVRPVANVAASPMPVSLGQTATPDANGVPVPNVPAQPVMASSIPANMEAMRQKFATAIQGNKADDFLKFLKPQEMVQETIYQKDKDGNIIGTTTRNVPKSSRSTVVGPQQPKTGTPLSPDRAEIQIIDKFNANPQVRRQQQSIDGASAIKELAESGNPIAAAAIPTYMARASGEVGALSEPDKAPFGGTREILRKLEASLTQLSTGQLTEENKKFLIDLSAIMEKNANMNLDRHGREMADQYSKTSIGKNIGAEQIFTTLRPNSKYKEEKKPDGVRKTASGIEYTVR